MNKNLTTTRTPSAIADEINSIKTQAGAVMASAFSFARRSVFEIGKRLEEAKSLLHHGEWGNWLAENVDYSESTANNIMRCYREFGDEQIDMLSGVSDADFFSSLKQSQMVELFALPKHERRAFVDEHREELESGEMSVRELKEEIKRLKEKNDQQAEDIRFNDETYNKLIEEFKQQGEELAALKSAPAPEPVVQEVIVNQPSEAQLEAVRAEAEEQLRAEFEEKLDAAEKEHAKEIDGWEVEAENWKQENVRLEKERDDEKKAAKQAAADHKADMERLKADHEKEMATLRESLKKQAKAQTAGADPSVVRVQIALENFRREVRTVAQVLNLLREDGDEKKAVMLQAQVERTVGAIIAETGWTL